ncbi:MAG: response regulator transcription factor [Planctomycetes bacterium]|nr:response regulator transcription factor [Planctomycetota bacterium]
MSAPIRVALVEDEPRTRAGLAAEIGSDPQLHVVGDFASMEEAWPSILVQPPDVLLQDLGLPGLSGIDGIRRYRARHPQALVLVLTVFGDDRHVFEAICAGASGYLLKDTPPERLRGAIRELVAGGAPISPGIARRILTIFQRFPSAPAAAELSPRELEVLRALVLGHSYKTAAGVLGLSLDTVRFHVRSIYAKLHVHSKSEAVVAAIRRGLV